MFFYMPVKVYAEEDCVKRHAAELAVLGTRALIVTGKSSAEKNGSLADWFRTSAFSPADVRIKAIPPYRAVTDDRP